MSDPFVYVVSSASGGCKIGFSRNPKERVAQLALLGHLQLTLVKTWQHKHARTIEAAALREAAPHRISGEWLSLRPDDAVALVDQIEADILSGRLRPSLLARRRLGEAPPADRSRMGIAGAAAYVASEQSRIMAAIDLIRDDWYSDQVPTTALLDRAGISYPVAKRHLGKRPFWVYAVGRSKPASKVMQNDGSMLKEAGGISYNTAASRLKGREVVQADYLAKLKRRLLREQRKTD